MYFLHAVIIYNAFGVGYQCKYIWAAGKIRGFYSGENPRRLIMRPILCTAVLSSAAPASDAPLRAASTPKIKAVGRAGPSSDRRGTNPAVPAAIEAALLWSSSCDFGSG